MVKKQLLHSNAHDIPVENYLLLVDDVDSCLYIGEGVRRRQDGFALVLLVQVAVCPAIQGEGSAVHEGAKVVVLVKIGDPFLQLIGVKVWLNIGDLEEGL